MYEICAKPMMTFNFISSSAMMMVMMINGENTIHVCVYYTLCKRVYAITNRIRNGSVLCVFAMICESLNQSTSKRIHHHQPMICNEFYSFDRSANACI